MIIEIDPSRKFQHEQDIKEQEKKRKEFGDRLDEIEKCLESNYVALDGSRHTLHKPLKN